MKFNDFHEKSKDPARGGFSHCGGTILTTRHVLTATHCTRKKDKNGRQVDIIRNGGAIFVVFGLLNWCPAKNKLDENWEGPWENIIPAEEITFHPSWNFDKSGKDFDIAIIKVRNA